MTLRECRQSRICPWKLINFNQSFDEVINKQRQNVSKWKFKNTFFGC